MHLCNANEINTKVRGTVFVQKIKKPLLSVACFNLWHSHCLAMTGLVTLSTHSQTAMPLMGLCRCLFTSHFIQVAHGKGRHHEGDMDKQVPHDFVVIDILHIHKDFQQVN